jgi:hypothetical protein
MKNNPMHSSMGWPQDFSLRRWFDPSGKTLATCNNCAPTAWPAVSPDAGERSRCKGMIPDRLRPQRYSTWRQRKIGRLPLLVELAIFMSEDTTVTCSQGASLRATS